MISRKGAVLAGTALAAVLVASFSFADDDEKTKIHLAMEKVQKANSKITKALRNEANYKKAKKEVITAAEELVKLGKDSRDDEGPAKKEGKTQEDWTKLMDSYITESESFVKSASESTAKQSDLKTAFGAVGKTCGACHKVFKKDDE